VFFGEAGLEGEIEIGLGFGFGGDGAGGYGDGFLSGGQRKKGTY
jgi:hypothetical protein